MSTFINLRQSSPAYAKIEEGSLSNSSEHDDIKDQFSSEQGTLAPIRRSWLRRHWIAIGVHTLLIISNLVIYIAAISRTWDPAHAFSKFMTQYVRKVILTLSCVAPLYDAIQYEDRTFEAVSIRLYNGTLNPDKPTDFGGDARPELEAAWKELSKSKQPALAQIECLSLTRRNADQNIRLTEEDLAQTDADDTVVQLTDGSGSYGTLTVFHGLHCVERMHRYLHYDSYYSSFSDEEETLLIWHLGKYPSSFCHHRFYTRYQQLNNL